MGFPLFLRMYAASNTAGTHKVEQFFGAEIGSTSAKAIWRSSYSVGKEMTKSPLQPRCLPVSEQDGNVPLTRYFWSRDSDAPICSPFRLLCNSWQRHRLRARATFQV